MGGANREQPRAGVTALPTPAASGPRPLIQDRTSLSPCSMETPTHGVGGLVAPRSWLTGLPRSLPTRLGSRGFWGCCLRLLPDAPGPGQSFTVRATACASSTKGSVWWWEGPSQTLSSTPTDRFFLAHSQTCRHAAGLGRHRRNAGELARFLPVPLGEEPGRKLQITPN